MISPLAGQTFAAGASMQILTETSGFQRSELELLVDGSVVDSFDEREGSIWWTPRGDLAPGTPLTLQVRARSGNGSSAITAPVGVSIAPTAAAAPTIAISYPSNGNSFRSGERFTFQATFSGVEPIHSELWFAGNSLGEPVRSGSTQFYGQMRMPALSADTTGELRVLLTDGTGRTAGAAVTVTVKGAGAEPTVPTGLPAVVRAGPTLNCFTSSTSADGATTLRLLVGDTTVASRTASYGTNSFYHCVLLPEDSVGSTVTLTQIAEDSLGRQTLATKSYPVAPDGEPPVVTWYWAPPASAHERATVTLYAYATDPDNDVASVKLFANGVQFAAANSSYVQAPFTLPLLSEASQVTFTAVATDKRGRTDSKSQVTVLTPNEPPIVNSYSPYPGYPLYTGYPEKICVNGTDDTGIASMALVVNGEAVTSSTSSCGTNCTKACVDVTVPASDLTVQATVTDALGLSSQATQRYSVAANAPPSLILSTDYYNDYDYDYFVAGRSYRLYVGLQDEKQPLATAEFRVDGVRLGAGFFSPSYGVEQYFTPPSPGPILVEAFATNLAGATSSVAIQGREVLAAGTGETCANPLALAVEQPRRPADVAAKPADHLSALDARRLVEAALRWAGGRGLSQRGHLVEHELQRSGWLRVRRHDLDLHARERRLRTLVGRCPDFRDRVVRKPRSGPDHLGTPGAGRSVRARVVQVHLRAWQLCSRCGGGEPLLRSGVRRWPGQRRRRSDRLLPERAGLLGADRRRRNRSRDARGLFEWSSTTTATVVPTGRSIRAARAPRDNSSRAMARAAPPRRS